MKVKYLIIGGGVSGLSLAYFLKDKDYLIVERENEVGGYCRTIHQQGYVWDYSGHFFHFKEKEIERLFLDQIPEEELIVSQKNTKIYYKGELIDYPFQYNISQLEKSEFVDCLYDLYYASSSGSYSSFKEMLYAKSGKSIAEKFLIPYNEKLYACDLNRLDEDAMGRFFPKPQLEKAIRNMKVQSDESYNNMFYYPKSGVSRYVEVLMEKLDALKVMLNTEIVRLDMEERAAYTKVGEKIEFEYLVNTTPFHSFINLLGKGGIQEVKSELTHNKVLVLNLGFDQAAVDPSIHWIYVPDKKINFYRVGFYSNILKEERLSLYVEESYRQKENVDIEMALDETLRNLKRMNIITTHELAAYHTVIMDPAYVHISKESNRIMEACCRALEVRNIYNIGRYALWKYCSIEDCILDAKRLAELFNMVENTKN